MKNSRFRLLLFVNVIVVGGLFLFMNQSVSAQWILRDGTAVNPIAVCQDGAYIGVGVQFDGAAGVTGRLLPGEEILFSQTFTPTTPVDNTVYPFLIRADYYYVFFDEAYTPLTVGDEVNFGYPAGIDVIGRVGDCYIDPNETEVGAGFTYQGRLDDNGNAADGTYDLQFRVFDARLTGDQVGSVLNIGDVEVVDGLFTVELDFGPAVFTGSGRWLEISVRDGASSGNYTTLAPRQEITAVPYALGLRGGAVISGTTLAGEGLLTIKNNIGEGLVIDRAHNGVMVNSSVSAGLMVNASDNDGVVINQAGRDGMIILEAEDTGISVGQAGDSGLSIGQTGSTAISVGTAGFDGVYVGGAGDDGLHVSSADNDGLHIGRTGSPSTYNTANNQNDGIEISDAEDDGIYISSAGDDGIEIVSTGDNGINISGTDIGMVINNSTDTGLFVNGATTYGIYVLGGGTYSGVFTGDVYVGGACTGCALATFAINSGTTPLSVGDIVAIGGITEQAIIGETDVMLNVKAAEVGDTAIGVVSQVGNIAQDDNNIPRFVESDRAAAPGSYVTIITYGVAQVKVSPASGSLMAGQRVTLGAHNEVRALQTTEVNGIQLAEDAPTIGTALEDFDGDADGLIWVLINPR